MTQAARENLILANLGLVVSVAKRCIAYVGWDVDMDDLISEGTVGLIHAVERFEPERGHQFSTYAVSAIRNSIVSYLNEHSRPIRIPRYAVAMFRGEVSKRRAGKAAIRNAPIIRARAEAALRPMERDDGFGITTAEPDIVDQLADDEELNRTRAAVGAAIGCLDSRERVIIDRRFMTEPRLTLDETAHLFTPVVSRERMRQLEAKALAKMREFLTEQYA